MNQESLERAPCVRIGIAAVVSWGSKCVERIETHIYFILDRREGWRVSGCQRKSHITRPQLVAAKTGQAFLLSVRSRCWGTRLSCVTANFARPKTTRAKTYITICWFTEDCIPRPKTVNPARNPAMNVSYEASWFNDLRLAPGRCFKVYMIALYVKANMARFLACCRVALKMRCIFSRKLSNGQRSCHTQQSLTEFTSQTWKETPSLTLSVMDQLDQSKTPLHESVRKSNFGAINSAIPSGFHQSKHAGIFRVENECIHGRLEPMSINFDNQSMYLLRFRPSWEYQQSLFYVMVFRSKYTQVEGSILNCCDIEKKWLCMWEYW